MKTLKMIALSIIYFIVTTILAVILALTTLLAYYSLQFFLFSRGTYLLFVSGGLNTIPIFMIMIMIVILFIYVFFRIQEKFFERKEKQIIIIDEEDGPVDMETLNKLQKLLFKLFNKFIALDNISTNLFKIIKICYISVFIISIYCGMTSYAILYSNSIKVGSPMNPTGITYKYSTITNVNVGVAGNNENSYEPYYKVIFNDNKSVNLLGGSSMQTDKEDFEYVLVNLDKKLRAQGVIKSANKENFDKYSIGLDKGFISRIEKLFNDK